MFKDKFMYRYRFLTTNMGIIKQSDILSLANTIHNMNLVISMMALLQKFDSELSYTLAQGE